MADNKKLLAFLAKYHTKMIPAGLPPYEPHHALPYVFMTAVDEMYEDIVKGDLTEFHREACAFSSSTQKSLLETFRMWMDGNTHIIGEDKDKTVNVGMERSGYVSRSVSDKLIIESMFGRAMLAAVWYAIRDITDEGCPTNEWVRYNELGNLMKESENIEKPDTRIDVGKYGPTRVDVNGSVETIEKEDSSDESNKEA